MTDRTSPSWRDLLVNAPTPFFVMSRERLHARYRHFAQFGSIRYPVKTNPHECVLSDLAELGCGFDVDSANHAQRLVELGVPADLIQFGLPIAKDEELARVAAFGVRRFVVESDDGYERV